MKNTWTQFQTRFNDKFPSPLSSLPSKFEQLVTRNSDTKTAKRGKKTRYYSTSLKFAQIVIPRVKWWREVFKKRFSLASKLYFFSSSSSFSPSLLIYMERGGGGVQLSWNVANFRANRRVFRMCSDSEKQVNLG